MDPNLTDEQWEQIDVELYAGKKIEAIKLFREYSSAGLKEAKDVLDDYERQLRAQYPDRFCHEAKKTGCLVAVSLLGSALMGLAVAAWLMTGL